MGGLIDSRGVQKSSILVKASGAEWRICGVLGDAPNRASLHLGICFASRIASSSIL